MLPHSRLLRRCRSGIESARTVEADMVVGGPDHRRVRVGIMDDRRIDVPDRGIISENIPRPGAPDEAAPIVAPSIIDPAVVPHGRSPISRIPGVTAIFVSPPAWCPEEAYFRRQYPYPGNPVVITGVGVPCPIAWCPYISISGTRRLVVNRQCRRGNRDSDIRRRDCWRKAQQRRE
jgi:hypothetical protein